MVGAVTVRGSTACWQLGVKEPFGSRWQFAFALPVYTPIGIRRGTAGNRSHSRLDATHLLCPLFTRPPLSQHSSPVSILPTTSGTVLRCLTVCNAFAFSGSPACRLRAAGRQGRLPQPIARCSLLRCRSLIVSPPLVQLSSALGNSPSEAPTQQRQLPSTTGSANLEIFERMPPRIRRALAARRSWSSEDMLAGLTGEEVV